MGQVSEKYKNIFNAQVGEHSSSRTARLSGPKSQSQPITAVIVMLVIFLVVPVIFVVMLVIGSMIVPV